MMPMGGGGVVTQPGIGGGSASAEISKLADLKAQGLLTDEEFSTASDRPSRFTRSYAYTPLVVSFSPLSGLPLLSYQVHRVIFPAGVVVAVDASVRVHACGVVRAQAPPLSAASFVAYSPSPLVVCGFWFVITQAKAKVLGL
jgi:hypothetical protein